MVKIENKTKENPKLEQNKLSDERISLYLEYYLGREEKLVLDESGNQVYYEDGKMQGKPKFSVKHNRRKDVLSLEEIQALINCHYENENPMVRRAFIFYLYCGLRFCDVKNLTYKNVDYSNKLLKFEQNKTKGYSSASGVVIPLNDGLLSIIGEPPTNGNKDVFIFNLPSY